MGLDEGCVGRAVVYRDLNWTRQKTEGYNREFGGCGRRKKRSEWRFLGSRGRRDQVEEA